MSKTLSLLSIAAFASGWASGSDQTIVGAGNAVAEQIAAKSMLVQSAKQVLINNAQAIRNSTLRSITLDAITNTGTCVTHRIGVDDAKKNLILQNLLNAGLINPADAAGITGGMEAGVFPPILKEGTTCPQLPLSFNAAPGSSFGGHHSYPGGLPVHEGNNDKSFINFANLYRTSYGTTGMVGLPIFTVLQSPNQQGENEDEDGNDNSGALISQDLVLGAPIWHDWAKTMVFQWNADGTEFTELNFGGNGTTDAWGAAGDSRTGGHHMLSIAEAMKRALPPDFVITQASAHSAPTSGNEYKVVNWLRAAAMIAQIDPVAAGYLTLDSQNHLRLPAVRQLGAGVNLNANGQTNLLVEYALHNLSDSDFNLSGPAVSEAQVLLATIAPNFGYNQADTTNYNTRFRNVALANLSAERLIMIYGNSGLQGVTAEVQKLRQRGII
jgi:hypothetical protein